ncbi:MAG: DUF4256 domain-containing protein [Candidatus Gracilibacteria bacterium]|jgi:hypothetical protein
MTYEGHERRKKAGNPDAQFEQDVAGLVQRVVREGVSIDDVDLREQGEERQRLIDGVNEKVNRLFPGRHSVEASPGPVAQTPEKVLTAENRTALFSFFEKRFMENPTRYQDIPFDSVKRALEAADPKLLYGLFKMEENGHKTGVKREERGGKNGFRFDSCSAESPTGVRDVDYFGAENIAGKDWGVPLMPKEVFEELREAGVIANRNTWDYLKTQDPGISSKPGLAWFGNAGGVRSSTARSHTRYGGFRCSLWVSEA